jgi:DNA-binding NarL/FixJ family response regulator
MRSRLILADDHPMVREGLRLLIETTTDLMVVAEACTGEEAEHLARTTPAELLILDIDMPLRNGINVAESLRADGIELPILVFTVAQANTNRYYAEHVGVQGFIGKAANAQALLQAIRTILAGGTWFPNISSTLARTDRDLPEKNLSQREWQILQGLLQGTSQVQMASDLGISTASVNTYRRRILDKFGVSSNAELIRLMSREGE